MRRKKTRRCSQCGEEKPKTPKYFHRDISHHSGYRRTCRLCHNKKQKEKTAKRKQNVIKVLGSKCISCGFEDWRALQVDHVNGGGSRERREPGGYKMIYNKIINGNKKGYQLLCANCNWIKKYNNNENR